MSSTSSHGWIDGVPLELRPRYYPKPQLRFKDIDIYIPLDAIENDYDFTEERRVLAECKFWEEEKEQKRLIEEEEEKRRLEEAELKLQEKLKLEEDEEIEHLREEASLEMAPVDSDTSLSEEDKRGEADPDPSIFQPDSEPSTETEAVVPDSFPHIQHQTVPNDYNYLIGSDMQMPMYQQTGQNYYNYYMQPTMPEAVAPIAPMFTAGQHSLPQSIASTMPPVQQYQLATAGASGGDVGVHPGTALQPHDAHSTPVGYPSPYPANTTTTNISDAAPSVPQYQSASGGSNSVHPGTVLQSHDAQSTPLGFHMSHPATTTSTGMSGANPVAHSVPQYQSAIASSSGSNRDGHSGTIPHSHDVQSTPVSFNMSHPATTTPTGMNDGASVAPSVPQYQSSNASASGGSAGFHPGTVLQSHDTQSTPVGFPSSHPATTTATSMSDSTPAAPSVPQYQSTNISVPGGNAGVHHGTVLQSQDTQSTPTGFHVSHPTTTTTTGRSDAIPVAPSSVPQYQSANVSASGGNRSGHSGSSLESHFHQPTSNQPGTQAAPPTTTATHSGERSEPGDNCTDNSFTKLHFPFLTSMAASPRSARDNGLGYVSSSFSHPFLAQSTAPPQHQTSSDDIATQNPFLSSYVQSRPPMQSHQYWTSSQLPPQLYPYQQQSQNHYNAPAHSTVSPDLNRPVHSGMGASNNFITNSGPSRETEPPTGSQHALR